VIDVQHITKNYGRRKVLRDISFTADKGTITCLIGINGAGKSTILKGIMGLVPLSSGTVTVDGTPMQPKLYEKLAFIPDTVTMPPRMKIRDALTFMQDFYVRWNEERARELMKFFKLDPSDRVSDLSKGNGAKLNLLLGLSLDADYVLMDEPFSGIDMFSREQIVNVFTSHLMDDRGVIITTHEIQDVEHLIDKAVLLHDGNVLKEIQVEDVRLQEGKSVVDVMREVYQP